MGIETSGQTKQLDGTEAALQRSGRIAWVVSLSLLGAAGAYFIMLYLVAH